jgi:hypothetical protein
MKKRRKGFSERLRPEDGEDPKTRVGDGALDRGPHLEVDPRANTGGTNVDGKGVRRKKSAFNTLHPAVARPQLLKIEPDIHPSLFKMLGELRGSARFGA